MDTTSVNRKWVLLLLGANTVFWVWFWIYFLAHPTFPMPQPVWEGGSSWAKAFGRNFGDGTSLAVVNTPVVRFATITFLPCVLLTWPISRFAPAGFEFAGFDAQGIRLILITALSFAQWVFIMKVWMTITKRLAKHQ